MTWLVILTASLCLVSLFPPKTLQSTLTDNPILLPHHINPPSASQPLNTFTPVEANQTQPNNLPPLTNSSKPTTKEKNNTNCEGDHDSMHIVTTNVSEVRLVLESVEPTSAGSIQELPDTTTRQQLTSSTTEEDLGDEDSEETTLEQQEALRLRCAELARQLLEAKLNPWNNLFYFLYCLLFIIGLSGNSLTVRAMTKKRKKSNIDLFILSLAMNDILVCIFNIPITPLYTLYYQRWIFGWTLCYVFTFAMCFSTYSSVFTLIAIAMVRYQMVVYPHCRWMTRRSVLGIIGLVSILGLSMTLPYMLNISQSNDSCSIPYCNESWSTIGGKFFFSMLTLISKSILPSVVVFFSYAAIYRKLKCRQKLHDRRKALLTIAYPSAFPIAKSMTVNHHHLKVLPASNTVPYELNAVHQQQLDERLIIDGTTRGMDSLNNHPPSYLLDTTRHPTSFSDKEALSNGMIDKYNSVTEMASDLGQVFGNPFELCTLLARKNSADLQSRHLPPAHISHQTTALVDGLVDDFVVQSAGEQTPKRPATSLGFLNKVVSATNLFRNEQLVRSAVESQIPLKTNTILALRENQIREKNQRMYRASRKLVIVVALFVACYLPVDIINVLNDYATYTDIIWNRNSYQFHSYYFVGAHLFNCASVCINPILYAWMSDNYRQELKNILPLWLTRRMFRD